MPADKTNQPDPSDPSNVTNPHPDSSSDSFSSDNIDTWKEFDQNIITHSAAHHLMAIDELFREFGYARVSDVARRLNITRGSVSISLQPLKRIGLVLQDVNRHLQLSDQGQALVDTIRTKRHLLERLLTDVLGVSAEQATIDACKMEHLTSNASAKQLVLLMRFIDTHPGGQDFIEQMRKFRAQCEHDPTRCATCTETCLAEQIDTKAPDQV
jgi:DtxR family Mn-dependent transcriptional regulator